MDALLRLPSLTALALVDCSIPTCLPTMTRLQQLQLVLCDAENLAGASETLRHLQQLTCLVGAGWVHCEGCWGDQAVQARCAVHAVPTCPVSSHRRS